MKRIIFTFMAVILAGLIICYPAHTAGAETITPKVYTAEEANTISDKLFGVKGLDHAFSAPSFKTTTKKGLAVDLPQFYKVLWPRHTPSLPDIYKVKPWVLLVTTIVIPPIAWIAYSVQRKKDLEKKNARNLGIAYAAALWWFIINPAVSFFYTMSQTPSTLKPYTLFIDNASPYNAEVQINGQSSIRIPKNCFIVEDARQLHANTTIRIKDRGKGSLLEEIKTDVSIQPDVVYVLNILGSNVYDIKMSKYE